ncbi:hypothetical protein L1987_19046 [Smallanthus sonchifolius]|uniref:Uncharacterized protein n=1 Tax=Smallanthus sonchifolius TaxID=185202 RepID=A0ACB9J3Y4_9ASTR|nr:hypothetical protein L1987_19046 [Smallanthus sonchifolius]
MLSRKSKATDWTWTFHPSSMARDQVLVGEKKNHHVHPGKIVTLDKTDLKVIKDHSNVVLGCVNDVKFVANLFRVCKQEGFMDVEIVYVGGSGCGWNFNHPWLLQNSNIVKMAWVDIQGLPLCAWSVKSFSKFAALWGEVLFLDKDLDDCLSSGRVCIRMNEKIVIRENVSVDIDEKMCQVRVNEFVSWVPSFKKIEEYESNDDESSKNEDGDSIETQRNEGSFGHVVREYVKELNKVTTISEHVEHVAVELVVPSYQEAINKIVVDTKAEVVNEPQETTEGPVVSTSTLRQWKT